MATKQQAINKISILAEQIRRTGSVNSVEVFCFVESDNQTTKRIGYYTPAMIKALMVEILTVHPEQAFEVLREYSKVISEKKLLFTDPEPSVPESPDGPAPATPGSTEPVPDAPGTEAFPADQPVASGA